MRGSGVRRLLGGAVLAWLVLGANALSAGKLPTIVVDPTSGPPGTTVTVTVFDCGLETSSPAGTEPSAANGTPTHFPGTGQLVIVVTGWGEPFETGFEGGFNDENGVATATFQVPNVPPGGYTIAAECVFVTCPTSIGVAACSADVAPAAFGAYPSTGFTVTSATATSPAAPAIEAQATTTG